MVSHSVVTSVFSAHRWSCFDAAATQYAESTCKPSRQWLPASPFSDAAAATSFTNAAAALLELSGVPNFRPHWRVYHWGLSLAGAALTLGAMFFLNYVFALITIATKR